MYEKAHNHVVQILVCVHLLFVMHAMKPVVFLAIVLPGSIPGGTFPQLEAFRGQERLPVASATLRRPSKGL